MGESTRISNGVEVVDFYTNKIYGMNINHFVSFDPTSETYIYNEAGESDIISGEIDIKDFVGSKSLSIYVPTLGSSSIDFQIEGKVAKESIWSAIYVQTVSVAMTNAIIISINEYIQVYRVGVKVNTNGTDIINCHTVIIDRHA